MDCAWSGPTIFTCFMKARIRMTWCCRRRRKGRTTCVFVNSTRAGTEAVKRVIDLMEGTRGSVARQQSVGI